jgi:small subunit ribosomal protein S6
MRNYEMMIILDPTLEERTVQPSLEQFLQVIAYDIDKRAEGIYAVVDLTAEPDTVRELDRQLNLNEAVLRTKVVRPQVH